MTMTATATERHASGTCPDWCVTLRLDLNVPLGASAACEVAGRTFRYTLLAAPTRFVLVEADPELAEEIGEALEQVRAHAAERAGWALTDNQPKLGVVAPAYTPDDAVRFRVQEVPGRWHRGMSGSGMLMLATAAAVRGSVVGIADHVSRCAEAYQVRAATPAGPRQVAIEDRAGEAWATYPLSPVVEVAELTV